MGNKGISIVILLAMAVIPLMAQNPQFPVYSDFSLPDPGKPTRITKNDLKLTDAFLDEYPDGIPVASREQLQELYRFFSNDPDGQKEWNSFSSLTSRVVSEWNVHSMGGFGATRYIYGVGNLKNVSIVYIFTGHPLVGEFIRANLAKMAGLPMTFWLHSELRGYDEEHPKGGLETASLNVMLSYAVPAVKKDMSEEELAAINTAWHDRAHIPCFNWLDNLRNNNWTAVIGCGLLYSSQYFNDTVARMRALNALKYYSDATVETDGSYAEGYSYFSYPVEQLFSAALVMNPREIRGTFGKSSMKGSMRWRIYGHLFDKEADGSPGVMRISFGDNPYGNRELYGSDKTSLFMQLVFKDGIAKWLRSKYGSHKSMDGVLLAAKIPDTNIPLYSPVGAGLPLVRSFEDGECYIRNNWNDEGIVLALKAGDGGSRVSYSHNRPELNNIALGAFGEYLVVTPGAASYRSKVHNEYDVLTRAANTITVDGMNQKSPMWPSFKEGRWDNRSVVVRDTSCAPVTRCESLPDGGAILQTDARGIYHIGMDEAYRNVRFVPVGEGGFFIVRDHLVPSDGNSHRFDYRLHIFNRDGKTIISGKPSKMLKVEREKAHLYIAVASPQVLGFQRLPGYMHHPEGRDYEEFGPKQGLPGSAVELDWNTESEVLDVTAILYPLHPDEKAPKIKIDSDSVTVNGINYKLE